MFHISFSRLKLKIASNSKIKMIIDLEKKIWEFAASVLMHSTIVAIDLLTNRLFNLTD